MNDLTPGDAIRLNDDPAEVSRTYPVGDLDEVVATTERAHLVDRFIQVGFARNL